MQLPSGVHRVSVRAAIDDDLIDTRPMPKRSRDDFESVCRLSASIGELAIDATTWHVAGRCASAMAEALQAEAVVILQHDALRGELRSIGVHGPNARVLLGSTRKVDEDYLVMAVLRNREPLRLLGSSRSLTMFPVLGTEGCVAIIEVAGVGEERQEGIVDACELVARRLVATLDSTENRGPECATFPKRMATLQCRLVR